MLPHPLAEVSALEPALQSRLELIQDKVVDLLHELQSADQAYSHVFPFSECIASMQNVLHRLTASSFEEDEITGPINWELFGETLFKRRSKAKMSQQELGARVGVTSTVIRYIENATKRPGRKTLLRLLAIPELQLKVNDVTRRSATGENAETGWLPNSLLSNGYDPVQMLTELKGILSGNGGQIEQSYLYIEPQSAADWMASCNSVAYIDAYRSSAGFEAMAKRIRECVGTGGIEVYALGCGDGRTEVALVQNLANAFPRPSDVRLNLLDISHSLLNVAYNHARASLEKIALYAVHGNFHELPRYPRGYSTGKPSCRLFTMLGYTLVNLEDEIRYFRDTLSGCESGDLFLADILIAYAPPECPEDIRRLDPSLRAVELRLSHAAWLGGVIRRHGNGVADVKFSLELDTRCPVPGSYGLDVIATVKMAGGKPDRRFLAWRQRRYDPEKLADALSGVGWEPKELLTYGPDGKSLALLLFRKR